MAQRLLAGWLGIWVAFTFIGAAFPYMDSSRFASKLFC